MKPLYILSLLFILSSSVQAAELIDLSHIESSVTKTRLRGDIQKNLPEVLRTSEQTTFTQRHFEADGGIQHLRFYQNFRGVQIWPQQLAVSVGASYIQRLNGSLVKNLEKDILSVKPNITSKTALALALNHFQSGYKRHFKWSTENEKSDLRIYVDPDSGESQLAYIVTFFTDTEPSGQPHRPIVIVNAHSGKIVKTIENLNTAKARGPAGNTKTGRYDYGKDFPELDVTVSGVNCIMQIGNIRTINLKGTVPKPTDVLKPHSFPCYENVETPINGAYGALNDAHFFAGVISSLYKDWYNTSPLKIPITMRVHYSKKYENAFWNGSSMTFGDGDVRFYPLVSLDVSSHEIAHGFTEFNSDLIYAGQSGGMNEAFSDMAGEAAEYYAKGKNDFEMGPEIFKAEGRALRYMYDPPKDNKSIDHVSKYTKTMDVHHSSGIYNKAFYILATTKGWTTRKAFDIFVKANQRYWTPTSTFLNGAKGVKSAASDLGYSVSDVVKAFAQVGINI